MTTSRPQPLFLAGDPQPLVLETPPPPRRTRLLLRLLRDLFIIAVVAVVLEGTLQLAAPRYRRHLFDGAFTGGYAINLNSLGLRSPEIAKDKPAGQRRVLALGDSTTYGTGVPLEGTWPQVLASSLAADHADVAVINTAMPALDPRSMRQFMEMHWAAYHPDALVYAVSANQISLAWISRNVPDFSADVPAPPPPSRAPGLKTRLRRAYKQLCLPAFLSLNAQRGLYWLGLLDHTVPPDAPFGGMLAHGWEQLDLPPLRAEEAWSIFKADLADLKASATRLGCPLIVTALPCRFMLTDRLLDNEKNIPRGRITIAPAERIRSLCQELQIEFVDAVGPLRSARAQSEAAGRFAPLYIQFDYTHLDEDGHRTVAQALRPAVAAALRLSPAPPPPAR